jgi:hypothetical protein
MPEIPQDKLAALAATGANNRQIESALGRKMTEAERATVDRQRLTDRLRRRVKKDAGPKSKADMMRINRNKDRLIGYEAPPRQKTPVDASWKKTLPSGLRTIARIVSPCRSGPFTRKL